MNPMTLSMGLFAKLKIRKQTKNFWLRWRARSLTVLAAVRRHEEYGLVPPPHKRTTTRYFCKRRESFEPSLCRSGRQYI